MGNKYIICCDFDGVLHSYTSGWKGATVIPDPPVEGALAWLVSISEDDRFELAVYSSRSKEEGGIHAMRDWLWEHLRHHAMNGGMGPGDAKEWAQRVLARLTFPLQKPAASMTIDDRAFHFCGEFPTKEWLLGFQPWNKSQRWWKEAPEVLRYYERPTPTRLKEIEEALSETSYEDRGTEDHAIGELLTEIYYLRGGRR